MTRNGLYKALALTALAQQGKAINDKLLETFSGQGQALWVACSNPFDLIPHYGGHMKEKPVKHSKHRLTPFSLCTITL